VFPKISVLAFFLVHTLSSFFQNAGLSSVPYPPFMQAFFVKDSALPDATRMLHLLFLTSEVWLLLHVAHILFGGLKETSPSA